MAKCLALLTLLPAIVAEIYILSVISFLGKIIVIVHILLIIFVTDRILMAPSRVE